jgi:hypothetical protein
LFEGNHAPFDEGENTRPGLLEALASKGFDVRPEWELPPEVLAKMESLVKEIGDRDYPVVWVGKPGITADELLEIQGMNEFLPEDLRMEPGQAVGADGPDGGFQMPEVGGTRLNGHDVVRYLGDEMDPDAFAKLRDEVVRIELAREGRVLLTIRTSGGHIPDVLPLPVTVDGIRGLPAELAEELVKELRFYADGYRGRPYVIPETERVKAFVAEHGEFFG